MPKPFRTLDDLPKTIAVFPLSGALLLPRGALPLNVFEPRYLAMVDDALYGTSWGDWSQEKEQLRARHTEDWLRTMGHPTGTFAWGEVWAGYDPKAASGGGGVRYFVEQTGSRQGRDYATVRLATLRLGLLLRSQTVH